MNCHETSKLLVWAKRLCTIVDLQDWHGSYQRKTAVHMAWMAVLHRTKTQHQGPKLTMTNNSKNKTAEEKEALKMVN